MTIAIYHNPRCSKSRKALELIQEHGIEPEVILYLETPPKIKEMKKIIERLGLESWQLIRFNDEKARSLRLHESDKRSANEWINILVSNPELMERPIVVRNSRALICRPPEKVLELL
jgi:arsenate reductase